MSLNKKDFDLLNYLNNIEQISLSNLAREFEVTERTLRYMIDNINLYLSPKIEIKIEKKMVTTKGFSLSEILEDLDISLYTFSKEERIRYLYLNYLYSDEKVTLLQLSEKLLITETTLKSDFKLAKKQLKERGLGFFAQGNNGYRIGEDESGKRAFALELMMEELDIDLLTKELKIEKVSNFGQEFIRKALLKLIDQRVYSLVCEFLIDINKKLNKTIADETFKVLAFYLYITYKNIEKGNCLMEKRNEEFLMGTSEYKVLEEDIDILETDGLKFGLEEKLRITEYLLGSKNYTNQGAYYEGWIQIEKRIEELIISVSKKINIPLYEDRELFDNLSNHIIPALYRISSNIFFEEKISKQVRKKYARLYRAIEEAIEENNYRIGLNGEEVAYVTIIFQSALKRVQKERINRNILIVCASGYSTSKFLAENLLDRYNINIVATIPFSELTTYRHREDIDLVITTLKDVEYIKFDKDIISVNPILTKEDIELLDEYNLPTGVEKIDIDKFIEFISKEVEVEDRVGLGKKLLEKYPKNFEEKKKANISYGLMDLLKETRIEIVEEISWQDAIDLGCNMLENEGFVEGSYREEIHKLIDKFGAYMLLNKKIILSHGKRGDNINKTGMSLILSKKAIKFVQEKESHMVVTLASKDKKEHLNALMDILYLVKTEGFIEDILEVGSRVELLGKLNYLLMRK